MPTDKLQILTPIVTSVNGQAGDVTVATKTSELTNDSYFVTQATLDEGLNGKIDKVEGKSLSTEDYTTEEKNKLSGIESGANNYSLPVATSTSLGGIKSGTDITVDSSGNVSVNDDSHNHVISNIDTLQDVLDAKVDVVDGKGLSTNDLTSALKSNYDTAYTHSQSEHAPSNAERNIIVSVQKNGTDVSVNSITRKVNITVPTKISDLTNDSDFATTTDLDTKVDKVTGKGLSTNDYTTEEKEKLAGIESGANKTTVDSSLSSTSTNPVQNKVINTKFTNIQSDIDSRVPNTRTVNGKALSSNITLSASDVGALPSTTVIPSIDGLATETYVDTKVAGLVDSAPDTLDTLNELAAALGDDPNFATTVANQIGTKVDKVDGKGLSTNDYTTAEKNKLSGIAANANNYSLPVATSSALGGVKSGTDITVDASGNVSVKDDSHNHVISNVDGLQDALDAKVSAVSGKGLSTNDLTATLKSNYDAAYTHSTSVHAPSNAERNVIVGIQKNGTDVAANSSTRKVNITVPTKVSELENDSKYLTSHQSLANYALKTDVQASLDTKVDKVTGKSLSTNDYTTAEKNKLAGIATGAQVNSITGVKGSAESAYRTGNVNITAANIGLGNVNNTSDANKPISTATQTALDSKQATITGGATTITSNNLTANRALISNSSGKVEVSAVTSTELSRLDGVTSNVQTQLNAKAAKSTTVSATLTVAGWSNNTQTVSVTGVTASSNLVITAAPASYIAYAEAGVRCTAQGSDTLTFACEETPTQALTANVLIVY